MKRKTLHLTAEKKIKKISSRSPAYKIKITTAFYKQL